MKLKWNLFLLLMLGSMYSYSTTASYYSDNDPRLTISRNFWSYFADTPTDHSLIPGSMASYLRNKSLRGGHYALRKPEFKNEVVILTNGPYFATVWRSGTAIHNETAVLDTLLQNATFRDLFSKLEYQFYQLPMYNPINLPQNKTPFYVYQMPGFDLKVTPENCQLFMNMIKQRGYTGDAFSCDNGYFRYIPAYSYLDVKHIGDWLN